MKGCINFQFHGNCLKKLKPSAQNACLKALWPLVTLNENIVSPEDSISQIIRLGHTLDEKGFSGIVNEDDHEFIYEA